MCLLLWLLEITCICLSLSLLNFILGFGLDLRFEGITASREWPNIFTKPLGSEVVSLFIRKVKFGTAFVVHVGVGTADVCARTSSSRKFQRKQAGVPTPTRISLQVLIWTLRSRYLTTPLPSGLVKMLGHSLDVKMPPNRGSSPNPKKTLRERETNKYK